MSRSSLLTAPAARARARLLPSALLAGAAALLAFACGEQPAAPAVPVPGDLSAVAKLTCVADVVARTLACASGESGTGTGAARSRALDPAHPGAAGTDLIVGGQNQFIKFSGGAATWNNVAGGFYTFPVTVQNLIGQALGTTDSTTVANGGVRVFFVTEPHTSTGAPVITVLNHDGSGTFTSTNQKYFEYPEILQPNATSTPHPWTFDVPSGVTSFTFQVYVSAPVQYPDGWVALSATGVALLRPGQTSTFSGVVKNHLGATVSGQTTAWSSTAPATATIDPSTGVMTAVAEGTTVIAGASGARSGHMTVTVVQPNAANSTVAAVSPTATSGDSVPVTVRVRTNAGADFPFDGDTVVLSASNGGATGPIVDNHDGTYSSIVTTTGTGAVVVSGTLNGTPIATSDTVTFSVGALHHFLVAQAAGGTIPQQSNAPFDVRIVAQDVNGNTVTGFTGTVGVTSSGTLTQGGGITPAFTAGVLATHTVQLSTDGVFTLTATRSGGTESGTSNSFRLDLAPAVSSTTPVDGASGVSPSSAITVAFSKSVNATTSSFSLSCAGNGTAAYTLNASPAATFTLTPTASLPGGATCTLTVNAAQVTTAFATPMAADLVRTFTTSLTATNDSYPETIVGNVAVSSANTISMPFRVTANDAVDGTTTLALVDGGTIAAGQQTVTTTAGSLVTLTVSGLNRGFFTFDPAPGLRGSDTFQYQLVGPSVSSSAATVTVPIGTGAMVWFVDLGAPACTTLAVGCGRLSHPFSTLAAFQAVNNDGVGRAKQGDAIFLYGNATSYLGPVTLLPDQNLVGQGASASLESLSGVTPTASAATFPATTAGLPTWIRGGTRDVMLASSGTTKIRGLSLLSTVPGGKALASGATFGTLDIAEVRIVNDSGSAIDITGGTLVATFTTLSSSGGGHGVSLTSVVGSGPIALGTGALSSSVGDALRLSGSSGTYTYTGTLAAGITGSAVNVIGGSASATLGGNLSQSSAFPIVSVSGGHTGTLTFNGTVVPAAGTGLQFDNADGSYAFNGTTTLTAAPMIGGIRIANGSTGTFGFSGLTAITMNGAAEIPLDVDGGTSVGGSNVNTTFTIAAPLTNNAGRVVRIQGMSGGGVTLSGNLASAGAGATGISVNNNSGGSIVFSGASKSFNTFANRAVTLLNNAGASVAFTSGTLAIATTSGTGFDASGGGTVSVTDAPTPVNTIVATAGAALRVENTTIGAGNITFKSISSGGATGSGGYGIALHNTGSAGGLRVLGNLGNARDGSGGTIQHRTGTTASTAVCSSPAAPLTGTGIHLLGTSNVELASMNLHDFDSYGIVGYSVSGFTMRGTVINGTNGSNAGADHDAVRFCNLTGAALMDSVLITGGATDGLHVTNDAGVLDRLVVQNGSSIGTGNAAGVNDAVTLESRDSATMKVTMAGTTLTGARGDMFQFSSNDQSVTDLVFTGNTVDNSYPTASILSAGGGVALSYDGGGRSATTVNTFDVETSSFRGANGIALNVLKLNGKGTMTGKLLGNTIGVSGMASSASQQSGGIQVMHAGSGTVTARVENNTVREYFGDAGIMIGAGDADPDVGVAAPVFNLTLNGNIAVGPSSGNAYGGIFADLGSQSWDTHQVCLAAGTTAPNNVGGGDPSLVSDFTLLRNWAGVTVKLPGYVGAPHVPTTVYDYLLARNTITNGSESFSINEGTAAGAGFTNTPGGAACPTVP